MGRFASNVGRMMAVFGIIYAFYHTPLSHSLCKDQEGVGMAELFFVLPRNQESVVSEKLKPGENHGCWDRSRDQA